MIRAGKYARTPSPPPTLAILSPLGVGVKGEVKDGSRRQRLDGEVEYDLNVGVHRIKRLRAVLSDLEARVRLRPRIRLV